IRCPQTVKAREVAFAGLASSLLRPFGPRRNQSSMISASPVPRGRGGGHRGVGAVVVVRLIRNRLHGGGGHGIRVELTVGIAQGLRGHLWRCRRLQGRGTRGSRGGGGGGGAVGVGGGGRRPGVVASAADDRAAAAVGGRAAGEVAAHAVAAAEGHRATAVTRQLPPADRGEGVVLFEANGGAAAAF